VCKEANDESRPAIQRLVYPQGIQFDGTSFGTAGIASTFNILGGKKTRNVDMLGHVYALRKLVGHSMGVADAYLDATVLNLEDAVARIPAIGEQKLAVMEFPRAR
tara:strand:+ start:373 stop:687 length:315 start_codon:yes stop_codon:yes gene_type:complete